MFITCFNKTLLICIDEFEKIPHYEANVLLDVMESQKLRSEKAANNKQYNLDMNLRIFSTGNNINKLTPEMKSRFLIFHLKEYLFEEFNMIATNIVTEKFNKTEEYAQKVALAIRYKMNSKDIRDILKVARLAKDEDEIDMIIEAIQAYKEN